MRTNEEKIINGHLIEKQNSTKKQKKDPHDMQKNRHLRVQLRYIQNSKDPSPSLKRAEKYKKKNLKEAATGHNDRTSQHHRLYSKTKTSG